MRGSSVLTENSRILKKVVDTEKGTLTFQVDWEAEENRTDL